MFIMISAPMRHSRIRNKPFHIQIQNIIKNDLFETIRFVNGGKIKT